MDGGGLVAVPAGRVGEGEAALRLLLLFHGLGGFVVGCLLVMDPAKGPAFRVLALMPAWPITWGLLLGVAGGLTIFGRVTGHLGVAKAGVVAQMMWYMCQALAFALTIPGGGNRYPVAIYATFAVILSVHLRWLRQHGRWR